MRVRLVRVVAEPEVTPAHVVVGHQPPCRVSTLTLK
jgi:hypothetical protein